MFESKVFRAFGERSKHGNKTRSNMKEYKKKILLQYKHCQSEYLGMRQALSL